MPTIPTNDERKRPLFSVPTVAQAANQDRSTVYRWCRAGLVRFKQAAPGRAVMIPRSEVRRVWGQDTLELLDLGEAKKRLRYGNRYPRPKGGGA